MLRMAQLRPTDGTQVEHKVGEYIPLDKFGHVEGTRSPIESSGRVFSSDAVVMDNIKAITRDAAFQ